MLSKNRFCLLDGKIHHKSPDHLFDLNFFDSMLYTISFLASVLSFFYLSCRSAPKKLFTTCWSVFHRFCHVLHFLRFANFKLAFLCKNFLAVLRNSSSSWKSLFPVEENYLFMGTNLSNQLMMSFVWREFSSMRRKMMKEDPGVSKVQAWGCPHAPPRNIQGDSSI